VPEKNENRESTRFADLAQFFTAYFSDKFIDKSKNKNGQFSVKTPNFRQKVHPVLKVRKPWQIWFIFSLQHVLERKKYKNGKKISMKLVR
jgi:hypothetical protein